MKTFNWPQKRFEPEDRYKDLNNFDANFWSKKELKDLSKEEWELLCDGCGKCCLNKIEIRGKVCFTNARCRFLDENSCLCKIYEHRFEKVDDCRDIDLQTVLTEPEILPKTCAYRLLAEGKSLPEWHPLVSGNADSIHDAKMSVRGRKMISETEVGNYEDYIIDWTDL
ncbi:MAG: YcgN family cysteine cluster protein [Alphaproteobacteria bacterium]|nr:YcgN family cysteine cluster protein [Alphaproteobacteria bacterium]